MFAYIDIQIHTTVIYRSTYTNKFTSIFISTSKSTLQSYIALHPHTPKNPHWELHPHLYPYWELHPYKYIHQHPNPNHIHIYIFTPTPQSTCASISATKTKVHTTSIFTPYSRQYLHHMHLHTCISISTSTNIPPTTNIHTPHPLPHYIHI